MTATLFITFKSHIIHTLYVAQLTAFGCTAAAVVHIKGGIRKIYILSSRWNWGIKYWSKREWSSTCIQNSNTMCVYAPLCVSMSLGRSKRRIHSTRKMKMLATMLATVAASANFFAFQLLLSSLLLLLLLFRQANGKIQHPLCLHWISSPFFRWKSNKDLRVWDKKATNRNIRTHKQNDFFSRFGFVLCFKGRVWKFRRMKINRTEHNNNDHNIEHSEVEKLANNDINGDDADSEDFPFKLLWESHFKMKRKKTKLGPKQKNTTRGRYRFSSFLPQHIHGSLVIILPWWKAEKERRRKKWRWKKENKIDQVIICFVFYRQFFFWCMAAVSWKRFDFLDSFSLSSRALFLSPSRSFPLRTFTLHVLDSVVSLEMFVFFLETDIFILWIFTAVLGYTHHTACWLNRLLCVMMMAA